jgi:dipeptidyl aminopeptidase/acylaminoacyl peptidase
MTSNSPGSTGHPLSCLAKRIKRFTRLLVITLTGVVVSLVCLDLILAWSFTSRLIHPGCQEPSPIAGLAAPEEHWVESQDGLSIRMWYYPSQNGAAILTLGGTNGSLGAQTFPVKALSETGYGILQVDSRACAVPAAAVTLGGNELLDAEAALAFLSTNPNINPNRIGVMGFSLGGATAIRLAARHPEIRAIVRDGGFSNLGEMLSPAKSDPFFQGIFKKTILILFQWRTDLDPWTVSPIDEVATISPRPVLLIYGEAEAEDGLAQYEAARSPKDLWIVPDSSHGKNYITAPEEYEQRLLSFFGQTLTQNE